MTDRRYALFTFAWTAANILALITFA